MFPQREKIMFSCHSNSISALFRHNSSFIDIIQLVLDYDRTIEPEIIVSFLQILTQDAVQDMTAYHFVQVASLNK